MSPPVLKQGSKLIASVQGDLADSDWKDLMENLLRLAGAHRSTGAILDLTGLDVIDSFAGRMISNIVLTLRLRGVEAVVAGIQPAVAFAMAQLGLELQGVVTALDFEEAAAELDRAGAARR